jgi:hypothetical protein
MCYDMKAVARSKDGLRIISAAPEATVNKDKISV